MIVDFHGMKCRYGTYRVMGETKPILTLVDEALDWKKSLQYDFTELQNGFRCHFLTEDEIKNFLPKEKADELLNEMHEKEMVSQVTDDLAVYYPKKITVRFIIELFVFPFMFIALPLLKIYFKKFAIFLKVYFHF